MPQFMVNDFSGRRFVLHSGDPETIGRWFVETMGRISASVSGTYNQPINMEVYPLYGPETGPDGRDRPDWCQNSSHSWCHYYQFNGTIEGLIAILHKAIEEGGPDR